MSRPPLRSVVVPPDAGAAAEKLPDSVRAMRNFETWRLYRARMAAADRAAKPFFVWPMFLFSGLTPGAIFLLRASGQARVVVFVAVVILGLASVALTAVGVRRRSKYLRDHPLPF